MDTAHNLTKGTMMATKTNLIKPPTNGLLKDTQEQNNSNCGVSPSENASQVIITQPILTKLVNIQITAEKIGHGFIIRNCMAFSLKAPLESSVKSITNFTHKEE